MWAQALIIMGHQRVLSEVGLIWVLYFGHTSIGVSCGSCIMGQVVYNFFWVLYLGLGFVV